MKGAAYVLSGRLPSPIERFFMRFSGTTFLLAVLGVVEETGLVVEVVEVLEVRTNARPPRIDIWLRCRSTGGSARPRAEVDEARFFELDSLPPLIAERERFLRDYRSRLVL